MGMIPELWDGKAAERIVDIIVFDKEVHNEISGLVLSWSIRCMSPYQCQGVG